MRRSNGRIARLEKLVAAILESHKEPIFIECPRCGDRMKVSGRYDSQQRVCSACTLMASAWESMDEMYDEFEQMMDCDRATRVCEDVGV